MVPQHAGFGAIMKQLRVSENWQSSDAPEASKNPTELGDFDPIS